MMCVGGKGVLKISTSWWLDNLDNVKLEHSAWQALNKWCGGGSGYIYYVTDSETVSVIP